MRMGEDNSPPLIQVTNVSPQATDQQMKELFSYLGSIKEIKVYPESDSILSFPSKVCFVKFVDISSCQTALHLTNSILVDRALIVVKSKYAEIPDENVALSLAAPAIAVANIGAQQPLTHTAPLLPTPPGLLNMSSGIGSSVLGNPPTTAATVAALSAALPGLAGIAPNMLQVPAVSVAAAAAATAAPAAKPLISVMGTVVPQPPPLTGNVDPTKIEEIRRTVYVGNLSTKPELTAEQVLTFFQPCGEIKYVRMAGDETQPTRFAFVEFASPDSVPIALQYNGAMFGDRPVKVNHSKNAIVKPQGPTPQEERREVEEAMKRIKEANKALATAVDTASNSEKPKTDKKKRSRTRSHSHSRSRSRSRGRRKRGSRSRSRDRRRRSYSRSPRRRSRSPRRRSRTPPRYSGSRYSSSRRDYGFSSRRSPSPRDRGRYRDRDRDRERERERERRERERERERDRDRERREKRRRSLSGSPRRSPSRKSRSSRKKERRDLSRTPSPHTVSPSRGSSSSKRVKRPKKEKKKRHRRSPSYSVSPTPSAESESHSPSPEPDVVAGTRGTGSMLWGSDEEGGARRRETEEEMINTDEGGQQSSEGESNEIGERGEESGDDDEGGRSLGEESDRQESSNREDLSDVE